jgi:hypothetical protein
LSPLSQISRTALFALALAGACFLLYGQYALGAIPGGMDNVLFTAPLFSVKWDDGLPLWDRWQASGSGYVDNLQAAPLYPPRWPFYFVEDWRDYFGPHCFLHYLIAFATAGLFFRGLGLSRGAALAGAILFAGGGGLGGRILNSTPFHAACWLPLLLHGAAGTERSRAWATTAAFAMILLTGSPHLMLYGVVGYGIVFASIALPKTLRETSEPRKAIGRLALSRMIHGALGLVIASPTLIPGVLRTGDSLRSETNAAANLADSVAWSELPYLFLGGTQAGIYPEYIDKSCYIGAVALILAFRGMLRRTAWRDGRVWAGAALVVVGVVFALGENIGLGYVMPYIPGFNQLQGPPRALILAAAGWSVLGALGLESLSGESARKTAFACLGLGAAALGWIAWMTAATDFGPLDWLWMWAQSPRAPRGWAFLALDAGVFLILGGAILTISPASSRLRQRLLLGLLLAQMIHFAPRVQLEPLGPEAFDPPEAVAWLAAFAAAHPEEPFRVVGYDALRLQAGGTTYLWNLDFLYPKTSTLFGLEDIHGFDPLLSRRYRDLIARTAGRAAYDDPIRTIEIERPDPRLLDLLNVRFVLGHPRDRRLTNLPQIVTPDSPVVRVDAWEAKGPKEMPIEQWLFVSFAARAAGRPLGTEIARLVVDAEEGRFAFPVRLGIETADITTLNAPEEWRRRLAIRPHLQWKMMFPDASGDHERLLAHWRGRIDFGRPLRVKSATWELAEPYRCVFYIAGQSCRLAPQEDDPWRLAHGQEDDLAPIFEYTAAQPRAALIPDFAASDGAVSLDESILATATAPEEAIRWRDRRTNSFALEVQTDAPALLFLREMWAPGWRAQIDGRDAKVLRINDLFLGVELPAGAKEVRFAYRPRLFFALLWLAGMTLAGCVGWASWEARRPRS